MPDYMAVVTVAAGPTSADITIDGTFVPIGPSDAGCLGGQNVITSNVDPIPFVFHAKGIKGFPVTLGIVLSPLPKGEDIKFNPPAYNIPESATLSVPDGKIPLKKVAAAEDVLMSSVKGGAVNGTDPGKKHSPAHAKAAASKGGKGQ